MRVCFTRTCLFVSACAWADHNKICVYDYDDKLSGNLEKGLITLLLLVCVSVSVMWFL